MRAYPLLAKSQSFPTSLLIAENYRLKSTRQIETKLLSLPTMNFADFSVCQLGNRTPLAHSNAQWTSNSPYWSGSLPSYTYKTSWPIPNPRRNISAMSKRYSRVSAVQELHSTWKLPILHKNYRLLRTCYPAQTSWNRIAYDGHYTRIEATNEHYQTSFFLGSMQRIPKTRFQFCTPCCAAECQAAKGTVKNLWTTLRRLGWGLCIC